MNKNLSQIKKEVYEVCGLEIINFELEPESKEYDASRFKLNGKKVLCRSAKLTPKKVGQFVTFWKRNEGGTIAPFEVSDLIDFYVVNVRTENKFGQFVFPKSVLVKRGIISTPKKEGKRAFRVYPIWDLVLSKQAKRTQQWQLEYFYEIKTSTNFNKVTELYKNR
ncbi:MepB family protein [Mesonia sp. MT50]|uniref:MepB family protein n=1 Tax=Mesonia profundi TaxID=3070998 RepID=A0ABU1A3V7_9FLAO|nr:MepB family protein [Mesonia profundi]MDQ7918390.1 MepB family protein [Mesonia profundi]